jgi:hypothetical protein
MEEVKARLEHGRVTGDGASGEATEVRWYCVMDSVLAPVRDRSETQLLQAPGESHLHDHSLLQGRTTEVLHRTPKGPTNEETLQALEV